MNKKKSFYSLKNKKILQILPSLEAGGVTQGVFEIAQALQKEEAHAFVVAHDGPRAQELKKMGINLISLPVHSKNPLTILKNSQLLTRLFQNEKIDLVHARSRAPAWSAYLACKKTGIPFVTTFHGTYNFKSPLKKFYNSIMVRGVRVVAISRFIQDHIFKHYGSYLPKKARVALIHRGINLEAFDPQRVDSKRLEALRKLWNLKQDTPLFLLPGRLTRWKGHLVVLEALSLLKDKKEFCCIFLGSDQGRSSYREELNTLIEKKGLTTRVKIITHCQDMPAAYALADLVLHASTDPEAFGRVIGEAQAMGKPVIATRHGAPKEILLEGKTGWLVEPEDAPALATLVEKAGYLSQTQKEKLAKVARAHIEKNFSLTQMCEKTLALYEEVLNETK